MTEKEKLNIRANIQANDCVKGVLMLFSSDIFDLMKEDETFLEELFDNLKDMMKENMNDIHK